MSALSFGDLIDHEGHAVSVVTYGSDQPENVAIECEDCNEVLLDYDKD